MEEGNTSIKCAGWNGRREYQNNLIYKFVFLQTSIRFRLMIRHTNIPPSSLPHFFIFPFLYTLFSLLFLFCFLLFFSFLLVLPFRFPLLLLFSLFFSFLFSFNFLLFLSFFFSYRFLSDSFLNFFYFSVICFPPLFPILLRLIFPYKCA